MSWKPLQRLSLLFLNISGFHVSGQLFVKRLPISDILKERAVKHVRGHWLRYPYSTYKSVELVEIEEVWNAGQAEEPCKDMHWLEFWADTRDGEVESKANAALFFQKAFCRTYALLLRAGWARRSFGDILGNISWSLSAERYYSRLVC